MAAPINVYSTYKLPISGSSVSYTLPIAINLPEYSIKQNFFLDKIFRVENDFIGMVKLDSVNYTFHNPNRFSKVRLKDESTNEVYILCNDGGLNTKGFSNLPTITKAQVGDLQWYSNFKSPYYDGFTSHGWEVVNLTNSLSNTVDNGTMGQRQNTSKTYSGWLFSMGINAGDSIKVRSYCNAPEGNHYSDYVTVTVQARMMNLGHDAYASYAANKFDASIFTTIYLSGAFLTSSDLYQNSSMTTNAAAGYYSDGNGNSWYKVEIVSGKARVTATGSATSGNFPVGDPSYITMVTWRGYDPSTSLNYGQSCAVASNGRTTYRDNNTNIHYKDVTKTQIADNGTYTVMVAPTTWYWHKIINGESISSGICGSG